MRSQSTVRVVLELDRATDRIGGSLHNAPRTFTGWLELGTLLEQARQGSAPNRLAADEIRPISA